MTGRDHTTHLLRKASSGDHRAADELMPLVYDELVRLAQQLMQMERAGHTLQATALVNEAYLKLVDQGRADWKDETHFFAVAATAIRRILVDHARARGRRKRGGDQAARHLGISTATAQRDWRYARAWLLQRLVGEAAGERPNGT